MRESPARRWTSFLFGIFMAATMIAVGASFHQLHAGGPDCVDYSCSNNGQCANPGGGDLECDICLGGRCAIIPAVE